MYNSVLTSTARPDIIDQNQNFRIERYEDMMAQTNHRLVAGHRLLQALDYEVAREEEKGLLVERNRKYQEMELLRAREKHMLECQRAELQLRARDVELAYGRIHGRLGEVQQATVNTALDLVKLQAQNEAYRLRNLEDIYMRKNIFVSNSVQEASAQCTCNGGLGKAPAP